MYSNASYYTDPAGNIIGMMCDINGTTTAVPLDPANSDYRKIMELVDAGELTIADPD